MWFLDGSSSAEVIFHDQSNLIMGVEYFFKKKKNSRKNFIYNFINLCDLRLRIDIFNWLLKILFLEVVVLCDLGLSTMA